MDNFSHTQRMLALSYISYLGFTLHRSERKNANRIKKEIQTTLSDPRWRPTYNRYELVWGPAVFALPGAELDDSLVYIVQQKAANNQGDNEYVVVVRGTNPISVTNWVIWDFQAKELKLWPGYKGDLSSAKEKDLPCISESSYFGLMVLTQIRPPIGVPGCNLSLAEFLAEQQQKHGSIKITTTGHSLGGALSPLVALYLHEGREMLFANKAEIETVTFAAPTPGNAVFADYFNQQLGEHTLRVANDLDIVTHAWVYKQMKQLSTIYLKHLPPLLPSLPLYLLMNNLTSRAKGKNYQHVGLNEAIFPGRFRMTAVPFLSQAIYQHVFSYPELLEIDKDIRIKDLLPFGSRLSEQLKHPLSI